MYTVTMDKFSWKPEYGVGIDSIDKQHKDFFAVTNDIIDLLEKEDVKREELLAAVVKLEEHGGEHFRTEEGYFDKVNYPGAKMHVEEPTPIGSGSLITTQRSKSPMPT